MGYVKHEIKQSGGKKELLTSANKNQQHAWQNNITVNKLRKSART